MASETSTFTDLKTVGELVDWKEIFTAKDGTTKKSVSLDEITKSKLLEQYFQDSLFFMMLNSIKIDTSSAGTTFIKNPGMIPKKRSAGIGLDTSSLDKFISGEKITVKFREPQILTTGIRALDLQFGAIPQIDSKQRMALQAMRNDFESYGFKKVEESIKAPFVKEFKLYEWKKELKTQNEVYRKLRAEIIKLGTKLTKTVDIQQGIHFLDKSKVLIFVKDEILDDIAEVGLLGDRVTQTFKDGATSIYEIGGYKIVASKFLDKYDVVITTNFSAAGDVLLIANNFSKIDPTNDMAVYIEYTYAADMLYNDFTYGIKVIEEAPSTNG